MSEVKTVSKAEQAQVIFTEVNGIRAEFIKRAIEELGMGKAGASTYFQNAKTKANGGKVKHYRPKKDDAATVDKSSDDVPESFELKLLDGTIKCFLNQQAYDEFVEQNPELIDPDQTISE